MALAVLLWQMPEDLRDAMNVQYSGLPGLPAIGSPHDVTELLHGLIRLSGPQRTPNLSCYSNPHHSRGVLVGCCYLDCPNRNKCLGVLLCARCRTARYCNASCQRAHWTIHKKVCTIMEAEADRCDAGGAVAAAKVLDDTRNGYRTSRLLGTIHLELALVYAAWSARFGSIPGIIIIDTPDLVAWNGGSKENPAVLEQTTLDDAPVVPENAVAFLSFLPLDQAFFYRRQYVAGIGVPHSEVYPPCHGPSALHVAPRRVHEAIIGPDPDITPGIVAMLQHRGMMTETLGPGATAAASDEIFVAVRDTGTGFTKAMSMLNPFHASSLVPLIHTNWERGVREQLAHTDVLVVSGGPGGRRFSLNYHCALEPIGREAPMTWVEREPEAAGGGDAAPAASLVALPAPVLPASATASAGPSGKSESDLG